MLNEISFVPVPHDGAMLKISEVNPRTFQSHVEEDLFTLVIVIQGQVLNLKNDNKVIFPHPLISSVQAEKMDSDQAKISITFKPGIFHRMRTLGTSLYIEFLPKAPRFK